MVSLSDVPIAADLPGAWPREQLTARNLTAGLAETLVLGTHHRLTLNV